MQPLRPSSIGNMFSSRCEKKKAKFIVKFETTEWRQSCAGAPQILDLVIAGEYPLAIRTLDQHA